jgi:hypothetical protein
MTGHERCRELAGVSGRLRNGDRGAWLACFDHAVIVRPLRLCGVPRVDGSPCRSIVREDLGHAACIAHSAPKRRAS